MWYKYIISKLKKDGFFNVIIVIFYVCVDIRLFWWYCNNLWRIQSFRKFVLINCGELLKFSILQFVMWIDYVYIKSS